MRRHARRRSASGGREAVAHGQAAVLQHQLVGADGDGDGQGRGGGRAAVHRAQPQLAELGLQVQLRVVHVVLEVAVRAVAVVLDLLAEADALPLA